MAVVRYQRLMGISMVTRTFGVILDARHAKVPEDEIFVLGDVAERWVIPEKFDQAMYIQANSPPFDMNDGYLAGLLEGLAIGGFAHRVGHDSVMPARIMWDWNNDPLLHCGPVSGWKVFDANGLEYGGDVLRCEVDTGVMHIRGPVNNKATGTFDLREEIGAAPLLVVPIQ